MFETFRFDIVLIPIDDLCWQDFGDGTDVPYETAAVLYNAYASCPVRPTAEGAPTRDFPLSRFPVAAHRRVTGLSVGERNYATD